MSLAQTAADFFELLKQGKTLEAIEQYYHEHAVQIENDDAPVKTKAALLKQEQASMNKVKWVTISMPSYIVNEKAGSVIGEMKIEFENNEGQKKMLEEAFVQKWKDGQLIHQRFYYNAITDAT